jgi:hypothetical protein
MSTDYDPRHRTKRAQGIYQGKETHQQSCIKSLLKKVRSQ